MSSSTHLNACTADSPTRNPEARGRLGSAEAIVNGPAALSFEDAGALELFAGLVEVELVNERRLRRMPYLSEYLDRFTSPNQASAVRRVFAEQPLREGDTLGPYKLVRQIGKGGMGEVWEAKNVRLADSSVALKVVRGGLLATDPELVERFQQEMTAAATLKDPYIVQLYHGDEANGHLFYTMELVAGQTLQQVVDARRKTGVMHAGPPKDGRAPAAAEDQTQHQAALGLVIDARTAARFIRDAAKGVQYVHEHGWLHRDIKPNNLMAEHSADDSSGKRDSTAVWGLVRVLDFGLAKALSATEPNDLPVKYAAGTPGYMAPEVLRTAPPTQRSDIYSLGATLATLLFGQPPRVSDSKRDNLGQFYDGSIPRVSRDLASICLRCLQYDPSKRYDSAKQLADDLDAFLNRRPVQARPLGNAGRFAYFCRRHPLSTTVAICVLAGIVGFGFRESFLRKQAETARNQAEARFELVRTLAKKFIFDLHDAVRDLPGSTAPRKLIVETGLDYLNRLEHEAGDHVDLLREIRLGYNKLGDVQGNSFAHLGDPSGALESYERGLELAVRVNGLLKARQATGPQWLQAQDDLAVSYAMLGDMRRIMGDARRALEFHDKCQDILGRQARAFPDHIQAQRQHSVSLNRVGRIHQELGEMDQARDRFEQSHQIVASAAQKQPDDAQLQLDVSVVLVSLGDLAEDTRAPDKALDLFTQAKTASEAALKLAPDDGLTRRHAALVWERLGNGLAASGRLPEAVEQHQLALELRKKMAAPDLNDAAAQFDLAVSHERLGDLQMQVGESAQALAHLLETVKIRERLNDSTRGRHAQVLQALFESYRLLGEWHAQAGSEPANSGDERRAIIQQAVTWYGKAVDALNQMETNGNLPPPLIVTRNSIALMVPKCEALIFAPQLHQGLAQARNDADFDAIVFLRTVSGELMGNSSVAYVAACISAAAAAHSESTSAPSWTTERASGHLAACRQFLEMAAKSGFFANPARFDEILDDADLVWLWKQSNKSELLESLRAAAALGPDPAKAESSAERGNK